MAVMLTTIDNPFDPFTQFDEWYVWDTRAGYHTSSYLARIVMNSKELSDVDQDLAITQAIDGIIAENITGVYKRVVREDIV